MKATLNVSTWKKAEAKPASIALNRPCCISSPTQSSAGQLQKTIGNREVQRLYKAGKLQAALKIGRPDDVYEQEADRVAEYVMRMPEPLVQKKCRCSSGGQPCAKCAEENEKLHIQRKTEASATSDSSVPDNFVSMPGLGQLLDMDIRSYFEPRFGWDFSRIRVHTGPQAANSAGSIDAKAYTSGNALVFGTGEYQPQSANGKKLSAHESAHTVQQRRHVQYLTIQRDCTDPNFCIPYPTVAEASAARSQLMSSYLPADGITFGSNSRRLFENFLNRKPGDSLSPIIFDDPSSDVVSSFSESWDTKNDQDAIIDMVGNRLDRSPALLRENTLTMMSLENFISRAELNNRPINYSNPFSIAGHIAGGIGSSDAGTDYRKIVWGNVTLQKVPLIGSTGYVKVETAPHYEVFDAIDFCPGDCGSPIEQTITIPMSRLEAGGEAYDVPFKVIFTPELRSKRFYYS